MKKFLFFISQLLLLKTYPNADNINFEKINSRHGLSSNYVTQAIQDKDGFMWFCTNDGLNRYDGYTIKNYKIHSDGSKYFNSNNFTCITEDRSGNLWLGTYQNGINIFNKETESVKIITTRNENGLVLPNDQIKGLHCDSKGRVWIASYSGVCKYIPGHDKIIVYNRNNENPVVPQGNIMSIYETREGKLFFGSWNNGLYQYVEETDSFIHFEVEQSLFTIHQPSPISCMLEDLEGNLWIGLWEGGLLKTKIKGNRMEYLDHYYYAPGSRNNRIGNNIIYCLSIDKKGAIWIGTGSGLNILRNPNDTNAVIETYSEGIMSYELSVSTVFNMVMDASGSMWLCTEGGGIDKVDLKRYNFEIYRIPNLKFSKTTKKIFAIYPLNEKEVLLGIGIIGIGLYNLEKQTITPYYKLPDFEGLIDIEDIHTGSCIFKDSKGNLWIGTLYSGLFKRDYISGKWERIIDINVFNEYSPISYQSMIEDNKGGLWVGTSRGLIKLVYNNEAQKYDAYTILPDSENPKSIVGKNITRLLFDSDNTLWVTSEDGGISRLVSSISQNDTFSFETDLLIPSSQSIKSDNHVNCIVEDKIGRIWIGTGSNGIMQYNKEKNMYTPYPDIVNLVGETIYDIIVDEEGGIWASTNKGLVRLVIRFNEVNVQNFTYEDGLQGNTFNRGAVGTDAEGNIYIGGVHGFNRFLPRKFRYNEYIPPIVISDISINNKPVERKRIKDNELILTHTENSFAVTFSALSYSQSKKNKFSHILEGFDKEWIMTDYQNREAVYTSLPSGKYKLKIKAANNSWVWNPNPTVLRIKVKPAPHLSLIAKIGYIIFFLVIIYGFYRFKLNNLQIKQAYEIEKIERRKEENINDFKLRFFTNISHELLTPLSIISFSVTESLEKNKFDRSFMISASKNVNRLMTLIRQLLDFRKIETGNMKLNVAPVSVDELFHQFAEYYLPLVKSRNINLQIKGQINNRVYIDMEKLETIVSNLLSNAFKYSQDEGVIEVNYALNGSGESMTLVVQVSDSGQGIDEKEIEHVFDRFYRVNSVTGKTFGAGIGLSLVKNLTELHKGTIQVSNNSERNGTIFTIEIPVSKEVYSPDDMGDSRESLAEKDLTFDFEESNIDDGLSNERDKKNEEYKIVVVEDNEELRKMIRNHLSNFYKVYDAPDGVQALKLTKKVDPNMIISDIMMPKMDGFALCEKIKGDIEYSHITVILLTAKVTNEDRTEGYALGADSYLSKPLDFRMLITRIESLRKHHQTIKDRYSHGLLSDTKPEGLSPLDQGFIKELIKIIKQDLTNQELNINYLLEKIPMSHSTLYRKTQNLTGLSPNEFIRYVRIDEAAKLLKNKDVRVADVAYKVGFNDQGYFSRCFKKQYNLTPKQYNKEEVKNLTNLKDKS